MNQVQEDELMLLWRQGTSAEPDAQEVARLAGRASMRRLDRLIFWRNSLEYAAGAAGVVFLGSLILKPDNPFDRTQGLTGLLCLGLTLGWLWWEHRDLTSLDS